jgi:hypothetical protein
MSYDRTPLTIPDPIRQALLDDGWRDCGSNEAYGFFDRQGYWLRVWPHFGAWRASVLPEPMDPVDREFYEEPSPSFIGRGSSERALEFARQLYERYRALLDPVGVELDCVGVLKNRSSGGRGSSIRTEVYRARDLGIERMDRPEEPDDASAPDKAAPKVRP